MALNRAILEMGAGNDLHGGDYTKAAIRAVEDALAVCIDRLASVETRDAQVDKEYVVARGSRRRRRAEREGRATRRCRRQRCGRARSKGK